MNRNLKITAIKSVFNTSNAIDTILNTFKFSSNRIAGSKSFLGFYRFDDSSAGFYKSFFVKIDERGMQISADFNVTGDEGGSGNILDSLKNGLNVLGLTDDNLVLLRKMILVNYIKFLRDKIAIS